METIREQRRMARDQQSEQERKLAEIRKAIGADEVRLHHEPKWLKQRIAEAVKRLALPRAYRGEIIGAWRFAQLIGGTASWLDHWGSIDEGDVFVSEPYLNVDHIAFALRFAIELDLRCDVSSVSWWNPPATTRLVFRRIGT